MFGKRFSKTIWTALVCFIVHWRSASKSKYQQQQAIGDVRRRVIAVFCFCLHKISTQRRIQNITTSANIFPVSSWVLAKLQHTHTYIHTMNSVNLCKRKYASVSVVRKAEYSGKRLSKQRPPTHTYLYITYIVEPNNGPLNHNNNNVLNGNLSPATVLKQRRCADNSQ